MGRKTWESLGRKLKHRKHIVLSSSHQEDADVQFNDLSTLKANIRPDSIIIGGATLAKEFFTPGNYIILTRVHVKCKTANSVNVTLPKTNIIWTSKTMSYKDLKFTFSIEKIL